MAEYVNLQGAEYTQLLTQLKELHAEAVAHEEAVRNCLEELMQSEGGFYVKDISDSVLEVLDTMKTMVAAPARANFANSETAIQEFVDAIVNTDIIVK